MIRNFRNLVLILGASVLLLNTIPSSTSSRAVFQTRPLGAAAEDHCPALPPPSGNTITVSNVNQLVNAVNNASAGDTILISDGEYHLDGAYLRIDTPNVTLRSASGDRQAVTLDGDYITTEIVQIVASNVTIADLTLREAYYHPIHVMSSSSSDTLDTLIYNVHIIDPGEQAIKINPYTGENAQYFTDDGVIACSHIELSDAGRPHIRNNCYTGGVDAHQSQNWVIRDNLIEGFWCANGLSEHGIHLWIACRDTLVERNVLVNNARGIGFGLTTYRANVRTYPDNPCPSAGGGYVDHYDGIIRNNSVFANNNSLFASEYGFDCGICLWQACDAQVLHNTVASTQAPFSSIEWRFDNTNVDVINNLVTHNLRDRGGASFVSGNLENAPLSLFVDGAGGDLHLVATASAAIDQADTLTAGLCDDDMDGDARPIGPANDIGADEYGAPAPTAVNNLRVTHALTGTGTLGFTLRWTPPTDAALIAIRYSNALITQANWDAAGSLIQDLTGSADTWTGDVPYESGTLYFALKSQNAGGEWSAISNNAFWPRHDVFLPLATRSY